MNLLNSPSDFAQKSVRLCDDWRLYCAPEASQDIGDMAAKREIGLRRFCPLAACVRQSMDWLMPFDAPATACVSLPLVALVQACLLYGLRLVGEPNTPVGCRRREKCYLNCKQRVGGSNPSAPTQKNKTLQHTVESCFIFCRYTISTRLRLNPLPFLCLFCPILAGRKNRQPFFILLTTSAILWEIIVIPPTNHILLSQNCTEVLHAI